jgi:hypothetical protein
MYVKRVTSQVQVFRISIRGVVEFANNQNHIENENGRMMA